MSERRVVALVSGKVQGVWYRGSARRQARQLGVTGYARNLDDGRVEVLACGSEAAVQALLDWCAGGPPLARVSRVAVRDEPGDVPADFTTG